MRWEEGKITKFGKNVSNSFWVTKGKLTGREVEGGGDKITPPTQVKVKYENSKPQNCTKQIDQTKTKRSFQFSKMNK